MQNAQPAEKRQHTRIPTSRPLVLLFNKQNIYATMTDFSRHGIGFMAAAKPELNSVVEIHFDIPESINGNNLHPFQFKAQVIHCIDCTETNHIGVRLELPTKEYTGLFDQYSSA